MSKIIEYRKKYVLRLFFCLVLMILILNVRVFAPEIHHATIRDDPLPHLALSEDDIIAELDDATDNPITKVLAECGEVNGLGAEFGNVEEYIEPLYLSFVPDLNIAPPSSEWGIYETRGIDVLLPYSGSPFDEPKVGSGYSFPLTVPIIRYQLAKDVSSKFASYDFENEVRIDTYDDELGIVSFLSLKQKCGPDKSKVYLVYHIDMYPINTVCTKCSITPYCNEYSFPGFEYFFISFWEVSLLKYEIFLKIIPPLGDNTVGARAVIKKGSLCAINTQIRTGHGIDHYQVVPSEEDCLTAYDKGLYNHNLRCAS